MLYISHPPLYFYFSAACCGHSFCAECYQQQLLANPLEQCPGPDCSQQISADSLIPNKSLRAAIQKYLNEVLFNLIIVLIKFLIF